MPLSQDRIDEALGFVRDKQFEAGGPGSRQHFQGNEERVYIIYALTHPACRNCDNLRIKNSTHGPTPVELHCRKFHSPIEIWRDWWPRDPLRTCTDCTDPEGRPKLAEL